MARSDPQINLRISAELKERIEAVAATNRRSMNAEIAARLEESFHVTEQGTLRPQSPTDKVLKDMLSQAMLEIADIKDRMEANGLKKP